MTIWTVGHSTRPIEELVGLLREHDITQLVDIRTVPGSRHNPQYSQNALESSLPEHGVRYVYRKDLGGLIEAYTEVAKRLGIMSENEKVQGGGPRLVQ